MAQRNIYTRVYSSRSPRQLVSGKWATDPPLPCDSLHDEFRNHSNLENRNPTALVSVSNRIIDTLNRAYAKHYTAGEAPEDIWVVFIEVPPGSTASIHSARALAEEFKVQKPKRFTYEFVFERAIPEEYVLHKVSLRTLMDRRLGLEWFLLEDPKDPTSRFIDTLELRSCLANDVLKVEDPWSAGDFLGYFAKAFGARAPTGWIWQQLWHDCKGFEMPDAAMEDAVYEVIIDQWLLEAGFLDKYEEFKEREAEMKEEMNWNCIDILEKSIWAPAEEDLYDDVRSLILTEKQRIMGEIEAHAVRIGL